MSSTKIPSPARSQGVISTPRQKRYRPSRSVGSPARSTTSVKLSALVQEEDSFNLLALPSRRSWLSDNTNIETPKRRSWWKQMDQNTNDMEFIESKEKERAANIEELIDADILSQEKKNYTIDLPDSSDGESIRSIVLPQRNFFKQKDQAQRLFKNIMDKRENLERLQKSNVNDDNTIHIAKKDLFNKGNRERSKPVFPAALLNISLDKTELYQKQKNISKQGQVRNLFGNLSGTKRKNMFAEFIVSDSEDEISEIQPKNSDQQRTRASTSHGIRESLITSNITDVEMDDWKQLPSSTMVENQFGNLESNTPVKKARLSNTMPALDETIKSKSGKVRTSNRSSKNYEKSHEIKDKPMENISQNRTLIEKKNNSSNSKTNQVANETHNVVESCAKVSEKPQNGYTSIDVPSIHNDSRNSKADENVNNVNKISQNISKNEKSNLQKNEECVVNEGNQAEIANIEICQNISKNHEGNKENREKKIGIEMRQNISKNYQGKLLEDEEIETSEQNRGEFGDNENSQNIPKTNEEVQQEDEECEVNESDQEEFCENEIRDNSSKSDEEYEASEDNQEKFNDNENEPDSFKNYEENSKENEQFVADERTPEVFINQSQNTSKNNEDNIQENKERMSDEENREEFDKMELFQNISKNNSHKQKDKQYIDAQVNREEANINHSENKNESRVKIIHEQSKKTIVEESKSIINNDENDVTDNKDQYKCVEEEKNNQSRNKSYRRDMNKSRANQDNVQNKNTTAHNKTIQQRSIQNRSKLNVTHDTTGRNRERLDPGVTSPEQVRNYIGNDMEFFAAADRETSSRKTRSVIKFNALRPSLAPMRESTGISDGTNNSSIERSGWDSHRTTRKTLRQTFGKDFTPRKSIRALVMEKSAKRQTYGLDVTTKIPQACSTRLPENMHDITSDEVIEPQHKTEVHIEMNEKVSVLETEKDENMKSSKEESVSHKSMGKISSEHRHSMVNDTRLKLQKNDVESDKLTSDLAIILNDKENGDKQNSSNSKTTDVITDKLEIDGTERNESNKEIQDSKVEEIRDSQNNQIEESGEEIRDSQGAEIEQNKEKMRDSQDAVEETSNEEMRNSQDAEIEDSQDAVEETSNEEMRDSRDAEIEASDEEMRDSRDVQEDVESENERNDSQDIDEKETDEESSQKVEEDEESDLEMRYSEENDAQESDEERRDSQDDEVESEDESIKPQYNENRVSDEGRKMYFFNSVEESDEEYIGSQYSIREVSRVQSANLTEELNREESLTRRRNIMEILQKVKQQNIEMNLQAKEAVLNSLTRPPRETPDFFKVPLRPNAGLRRLKPVTSKPKPKTVKSSNMGFKNLPPEVLQDFNYKPPKRFRPSNASWITKHLYKFLETKLEPKYDYKARVRAEKLAETLYGFAKETHRRSVADPISVDALKHEMARLGIVSTHFEFYEFFHEFMPREIRIKVVPDIVNKISMPKHGIFSDIII